MREGIASDDPMRVIRFLGKMTNVTQRVHTNSLRSSYLHTKCDDVC